MNTNEEKLDEEKKKFLLRNWKMALVMAASFVVAAIVALFVFLWVVETGTFPASLGDWTVGLIVSFILQVIFWELLLVVTWVIPIAAAFYWWFNKLSSLV